MKAMSESPAGANAKASQRRGRRGGRRKRNRRAGTTGPRTPRFLGMEPALQGSVYSYLGYLGERNPEMWVKTTQDIQKFVGNKYSKYTRELTLAVSRLELVDPTAPTLAQNADVAATETWILEYKEYRDRVQEYANFRSGLYWLVLGQCTPQMEDRLRTHPDFAAANHNGLALLKIIRLLLYGFDERMYHCDVVNEIRREFYSIIQGERESVQDYYQRIIGMVEVMNELEITIEDEGSIKECATANGRPGAPTADDRTEARQRAIAFNFMKGVRNRNPKYLRRLPNSFLEVCWNFV